ncbi:MAG TPA: ribonuclease M5 [Erysipelothrix sp.]
MKIKEVIVVEGKHDQSKILSCISADIIISNGTHLSQQFLAQCKKLNEERGIIIFTDPDYPGTYIRKKIMDYVGDCKHASLDINQAKLDGKVGVENASCEDILKALSKSAEFSTDEQSISYHDFLDLGLSGDKHSQIKRDKLSNQFGLPKTNAKTCYKYLNMMGVTKETCRKILGE